MSQNLDLQNISLFVETKKKQICKLLWISGVLFIDDIFNFLDNILNSKHNSQLYLHIIAQTFCKYENFTHQTFQPAYANLGSATRNSAMTYIESCNNLPNNLKTKEFNYTDSAQTWTVPCTGNFKFELYGAEGGAGYWNGTSDAWYGGKGGYVTAQTKLSKDMILYVHVGNKGANANTNNTRNATSYNGGGSGAYESYGQNQNTWGGAGGGAADIRLTSGAWNDTTSLRSRILVAGGGGGGAISCDDNRYNYSGIQGGNTNKSSEYVYTYSVCRVNYFAGSFGGGANGSVSNEVGGGGGGGGYYGGGSRSDSVDASPGFGGTSYVSGYTGCDTTYLPYQKLNGSNITFTNVSFTQGAKSGNGYVKITQV